ncbi:uncharacterized protein LOC18022188 isoform X2 [Eutrema salsugineum]|uniref:uncharacterized protein LOC18022188 isoform X2 n=1 Tax=Eutrema salsugineum TaxID=72664 RepID=UPI000CED75ED|nr:uncharacterized protein LOC18022188 isoform X2 [Eutrema salsugineum]
MKSTKPMSVTKDEWVTAALTDDEMVVELLLRLKHAGTVVSDDNPAANLPLLQWGFRQRRSRPSRLGVGVGGFLKKETDSARASPMTPLCWSGGSGSGGSGSGGSTCPSAATADGFEHTSRQASCSTSTGSGSKAVHATNEITSSSFRRLKKKKTFLELKDAENFQLNERFHLEKIANVQATYQERSAKNKSLKRIKLEYSDRIKNIPISNSNLDEPRKKRRLPSSISQKLVRNENSYRSTSETKSSEEKGFFFLPDLNMTPTDENETLYGTS